MPVLKFILRNVLRHKVRAGLTVLGFAVALVAFGVLSTVVGAWYAAADKAAPTRLVTRNGISLAFPLPLYYRDKIRALDGVRSVSHATWFGGIYQNPKNFFAQFAIDPGSYLPMYPEFLFKDEELRAFLRDRKGAIIGRNLANTYGLKVGDSLPLRGTIFPGNWEFTVRAVYDGAKANTDTSQMLFHWQYLNETLKGRTRGGDTDQIGVFLVDIHDPRRAAEIGRAIDVLFVNSLAETLTETEKAFHLSFVAMADALILAIRLVSFVVIVIILAVMGNTMAMTARERLSEYATLKTLGFGPGFVGVLIFGESLAVAAAGALAGIASTFPVARLFAAQTGTLFAIFEVSAATVAMQAGCAVVVGIGAALLPARRAVTMRIVDGLRAIG
jgi:putative ABC transport system permease protein